MGLAVVQDERAIGELVEGCFVMTLSLRARRDALGVELRVDRVGSDLAWMQVRPDRREADVVLASAQRARTMTGSERGRFVQEEQLGEPPPAASAARGASRGTGAGRRSTACGVPSADTSAVVVEAAAVAVDQASCGIRDHLAERRDAVLQRHPDTVAAGTE